MKRPPSTCGRPQAARPTASRSAWWRAGCIASRGWSWTHGDAPVPTSTPASIPADLRRHDVRQRVQHGRARPIPDAQRGPRHLSADGPASDGVHRWQAEPTGGNGEYPAHDCRRRFLLDNIVITTTAGVTVSGQIVFHPGPPPEATGQLRVTAVRNDPLDGFGMNPQAALVQPDLTFTLKGVVGEFLLRTGMAGAFLKSVTLGGDDITDTPREFKAGDRVTIVLTSRASTLEGNVTGATGAPAADAGVIMFSEDKATWRMSSTGVHRSSSDASGHFRMEGSASRSLLPRRGATGARLPAGIRGRLVLRRPDEGRHQHRHRRRRATDDGRSSRRPRRIP